MTQEILKEMTDLVEELKSNKNLLSTIAESLNKSVKKSEEETDSNQAKLSGLEKEKEVVTAAILDLNTSIKKNKTKIAELQPNISKQDSLKNELNQNISELESKISELQTQNAALEKNLAELNKELAEKEKAKDSLLGSIESKVKSNLDSLEVVKKEFDGLGAKYSAMEYLFKKIETPEVEIMAIIAAHRPVTTEIVKSNAKTVLPIMASRALTKLEADGKIINLDNKWDLSPSILEKLNA